MVLWAHLPAHHAVEPCWNHMKNVSLPNFVPTADAELVENVYKAAMKINERRLGQQFCKQTKLIWQSNFKWQISKCR